MSVETNLIPYIYTLSHTQAPTYKSILTIQNQFTHNLKQAANRDMRRMTKIKLHCSAIVIRGQRSLKLTLTGENEQQLTQQQLTQQQLTQQRSSPSTTAHSHNA